MKPRPLAGSEIQIDRSEVFKRGGTSVLFGGTARGCRAVIKRYEAEPSAERLGRREADILERVPKHPNVCGLLGLARDDRGRLYIAMERGGTPLSPELAAAALGDPRIAVDIGVNLLRGLEALHGAGFVHRDVGCGNFVIDRDLPATLKLIDLNSAVPIGTETRSRSRWGDASTRSEVWVGADTPPEWNYANHVVIAQPTADLYPVAVLVWKLATGHPPFDIDEAAKKAGVATRRSAWEAAYARGPAHGEKLDPGLRAALEKALAIDPAARWQSAAQLIRALEPFGSASQPAAA